MRPRALCAMCVLAVMGCNDELASRLTASSGAFAVLSEKSQAGTTVSLLNDMGLLSKDDWFGSKTMNDKLLTPLSEDVVLPTLSTDVRVLTTIERGLAVLTRIDMGSSAVLGQLRTDDSPEDDPTAFHSNPQDVIYFDEESAWVTRSRQNPDANADERERGNDLIEWNPTTFKRTARRIDLSDLNQDIDEMQFDQAGNATGTGKATAYASPANLVPVGDYIAVGLTGGTLKNNYAPGKLAIVDLEKGERVSVLDLEGLSNCGEVRHVAGDDVRVIVACKGANDDMGEHAGMFLVSVDDKGTAKIERRYLRTEHMEDRQITGNVASVGGDIVVAVAAGHSDSESTMPAEPDRLMRVDLASGTQTEVYKSAGALAIGKPAMAEKSGILLVPDAGGDEKNPSTGVQRFIVTVNRSVKLVDWVPVASQSKLPARQVLGL